MGGGWRVKEPKPRELTEANEVKPPLNKGLKNMDITFVLAKIHDAFVVYTNTGNMPAAAKRSVTIQLTDGQIKQIHKQKEEDVTDIFIESYSDK